MKAPLAPSRRTSELLWSITGTYSDSLPPFPPPCWHGEPRPHGARTVRLQTQFPSIGFLTYLVRDLGYDGNAAFGAMTRGHLPWLGSVDRRRISVVSNGNGQPDTKARTPIISVVHPYLPAAPSRRTKVGGGLTKEQVQKALAKKRWDSQMKQAVFEIVYRRRSTLEVSNESGKPIETLYVYASRLRRDLQEPDSHVSENVA